jgi:hypothetical protein
VGGDAGDTLDSAATVAAGIAGISLFFGPAGVPAAAFFGGVAIGLAATAAYAHATERK